MKVYGPTRYPNPQAYAPSGFAGLTYPRGFGALGNASVAFRWKATTYINVSDWLFGGGWNAAENRFKSELVRRGFSITQVTNEVNSYLPRLTYNLIVSGLAPTGIDGAERLIADAADAAGFSVDRDTIQAHFGGTAVPDDRDDDNEDSDNTLLYVAGGALILLLLLRR